MNIAIIVQRFGQDVAGGNENHARVFAQFLSAHHSVEILTTTAVDYVTWREGFAPGVELLDGLKVRRFAVDKPRNPQRFKEISETVFDGPHEIEDELRWVEENGPRCQGMVEYLKQHGAEYDRFLIFTYRYWTAFYTLPLVKDRALLIPTAEDDPALRLEIFRSMLELPAAMVYMTPEERDLLQSAALSPLPPGEFIGYPLGPASPAKPEEFLKKYEIDRPFALYLGRIDRNKGCEVLFDYILRYFRKSRSSLDLVVAGPSSLQIPQHPRLKVLGFLSPEDKENALAAATCLVMPSFLESLCIVLLEAWRRGTPTLANGHCKVLKGQTIRSGGGLYYESFGDFCELLEWLAKSPGLKEALSGSGRRFIATKESWEVKGPVFERLILEAGA